MQTPALGDIRRIEPDTPLSRKTGPGLQGRREVSEVAQGPSLRRERPLRDNAHTGKLNSEWPRGFPTKSTKNRALPTLSRSSRSNETRSRRAPLFRESIGDVTNYAFGPSDIPVRLGDAFGKRVALTPGGSELESKFGSVCRGPTRAEPFLPTHAGFGMVKNRLGAIEARARRRPIGRSPRRVPEQDFEHRGVSSGPEIADGRMRPQIVFAGPLVPQIGRNKYINLRKRAFAPARPDHIQLFAEPSRAPCGDPSEIPPGQRANRRVSASASRRPEATAITRAEAIAEHERPADFERRSYRQKRTDRPFGFLEHWRPEAQEPHMRGALMIGKQAPPNSSAKIAFARARKASGQRRQSVRDRIYANLASRFPRRREWRHSSPR